MQRRAVRVNEYLLNVKLSEMTSVINAVKSDIDTIKKTIKSDDDLWDGSDIIRNWHVSERTLADWRKKKIIGYVQINKKIFYPKQLRDRFINDNSIKKEV
jgi:hypothetical protein